MRLDTFEQSETGNSRLLAVTTEYYMLRIYLVSHYWPRVQSSRLTVKLVVVSRKAGYRRAPVL